MMQRIRLLVCRFLSKFHICLIHPRSQNHHTLPPIDTSSQIRESDKAIQPAYPNHWDFDASNDLFLCDFGQGGCFFWGESLSQDVIAHRDPVNDDHQEVVALESHEAFRQEVDEPRVGNHSRNRRAEIHDVPIELQRGITATHDHFVVHRANVSRDQ